MSILRCLPRLSIVRTAIALAAVGASVTACDDKSSNTPVDAKSDAPADPPRAGEDPTRAPTARNIAAPDAKDDAGKPNDAEQPADTTAADEPIADAGAPGPTYFAVRDRGVIKLDDGAFTTIAGAPHILLRDMHVAEDGNLYLLGPNGIMRIERDKATLVAETSFKTTGSVDAFAVTKDGTIWAVGHKGISTWDGKRWTTQEKSVLGSEITLLKGIVIDGNQRPWIASSNKLHTREGEAWVVVDTEKAFDRKPFYDALRRAPDGTAYAVASNGLVKAEAPDRIVPVELGIEGFTMLGDLAFASNGVLALRTRPDAVLVRRPDGKTREYTAGKDFAADSIRTIGVDGQGRAWVGTDAGVAVLGPGDAKVEWRSGSVLQLAGQVEQIVPLGAGPDLPPVGPVKTAELAGKILQDGQALADAAVELCPSPDMMFKTSPCGDAPVKFAGKTDANGEFAFTEVPIGAYGIAVEVAGKWQLTMASNFGTKMKEGERYDIGSIEVKAD